VKKGDKYIDPALGEDRFDFSGKPLPEEDVEKAKAERLKR